MARANLRQVFPSQVQVAETDLEPVTNDGLGALRMVRGTFDFAVQGGVVGTIGLLDDQGQAITLPDNAVLWDSCVDVTTTFTSPTTDDATVAIVVGANDIVAAAAIDTGTPWDAGLRAGVPVGTVATAIKIDGALALSVVIAIEDITAGAFVVTLIYFVGD